MQKISMDKQYETFSGFKVKILCVDMPDERFPVVGYYIMHNGVCQVCAWPADGNFRGVDSHSLALREVSDWDDFKVDDIVLVKSYGDSDDSWRIRYFAGTKYNRPYVWVAGKTQLTARSEIEVSVWDQCRKPTQDEMNKILESAKSKVVK